MNKKMITTLSLVLGTALAASAAFADMIAGNGYYTIKESLKRTTALVASGEMDNFTLTASVTISADGAELYKGEDITKYDEDASENISSVKKIIKGKTERSTTNYNDREKNIYVYKNEENKVRATVYQYPEKIRDPKMLHDDPFQREEIKDFETVVDAGVGNLKDALFVEENADGKMYYASIDNAQIPVFINALSSFFMKYSVFDDYQIKEYGLPEMRDNISIINASGKAFENKDGILTEGIVSVTVSGTDKGGAEHEVVLSILISINDIGTTDAVEPDLTGIETEFVEVEGARETRGYAIDEKYVGTYKADIVKVVDDKFVKTGEKRLVITEATTEIVKGTFEKIYSDDESENMYIEFTSFDPYENNEEFKSYFYNDVPIKYVLDGEEKTGLITNNFYGSDDEAVMLLFDPDVEFMEEGGMRHHSTNQFNLVKVLE